MRRFLLALVALLMIPGVALAGGAGVDTSGCPGYSEGTTVTMLDSCFSGVAHFAPSDSTITVRNEGGLPHTLTAVDGSFDTGDVAPGGTAELTFEEAGIYRVFCALHGTAAGEGMAGVVVVGEATPATVLAPMDTTAISEAVAAQNESIVDALKGQRSSVQNLNAMQTRLVAALDALNSAEPAPAQAPAPVQVDLRDSGQTVLMIAVGLAAGLALAALATALRLGRVADREARLERLEPEIG